MPMLVCGWSAVGLAKNDVSLRLLGILIGLAIPAIFWLTSWIVKRPPPLLGLTLFGLNSTVIFWGDSLRAYGLGSLLIATAIAAVWFFLQKPSWLRAGILAGAGILNVQTLYQNTVLFAAICFGAWAVCWRWKNRRAACKIFMSGLIAAASLLPYWTAMSRLLESTSERRTMFLPEMSWDNLHTLTGFPLPSYAYVWGLLVLIVLGLGCKALLAGNSNPKNRAYNEPITKEDLQLFAAITSLATMVGFAGFLWFSKMPTQTWYFLPLIAVAAICFDLSVSLTMLPRFLKIVVFGIIVATALIAIPFAHRDLSYRFTNVDLIAKYLLREASPQDFIVVTPWYMGISFEHYFHGATPWNTQPPLQDHSLHRYDLIELEMQNPQVLQPVLNQIAATLKSGHRIWIVGWMDIPSPGRRSVNLTTQFILEHSLEFKPVALSSSDHVYDYEDLKLLTADGWKDSATSESRLP